MKRGFKIILLFAFGFNLLKSENVILSHPMIWEFANIEDMSPFGISLGEDLPEEIRGLARETMFGNYAVCVNSDPNAKEYSGAYIPNPNEFLPEIRIFTERPPKYKVQKVVASYTAHNAFEKGGDGLYSDHLLYSINGKDFAERSKDIAITTTENFILDTSKILHSLINKYGGRDKLGFNQDILLEECEKLVRANLKGGPLNGFHNVYEWIIYDKVAGFRKYTIKFEIKASVGSAYRDLQRFLSYTEWRIPNRNYGKGL